MRFMFLLHVDESDGPGREVMIERHVKFAKEAIARGAYLTGDALDDPRNATTVRVRGGKPLQTDGPYAETKERFGGFYILDFPSREEAVAFARETPGVDFGSVEVRAVVDIPGWDEMIGWRGARS